MWLLVFVFSFQSYQELLSEGAAAMEAGRYAEAEQKLTLALELDADPPQTRLLLGNLYLSTDRPERALAVIEPLARSVPEPDRSPMLSTVYGLALAQSGRHEDALAPLQAALKAQPRRAVALFHYGRSLQALERFEEAAEAYRRGIDFPPPENIRFALGLARCQIRLERFDEARRGLDVLLDAHPQVGRAWLLRGVVAFEQGDFETSEADVRRGIDLGYDLAESDLRLGMALGMLDRYDEAQVALDRALAREPDLATAYYYKGLFAFEEGETLAPGRENPFGMHAVRLLERSRELAPNPKTSLALAEAYLRIGQYPRVIEAATDATKVPVLAPRALHLMALAHHELLEYEPAEAAYQRASQSGDPTAALYHDWGNLLSVMGRWEEARVLLEESLDLAPDAPGTLLQLGVVQMNLDNAGLAVEYLARVTTLAPQNAEAWYQKGVVESRQGDAEAAAASWTRALEIDPEQPRLYYRLGAELVKLGRVEERNILLEEFQERERESELRAQRSEQLSNLLNGAVAAAESEDDARAVALLSEAKKLAPDEALPYVYLGDLYLSRNRFEDAEATLREGIEKLPDQLALYQTLLSVYEAQGNSKGAEATRITIRELVRGS